MIGNAIFAALNMAAWWFYDTDLNLFVGGFCAAFFTVDVVDAWRFRR